MTNDNKLNNQTPPPVGEHAKVYLPGESPWAIVLEHTPKGFIGKIDNHLFAEKDEFTRNNIFKSWFGKGGGAKRLHSYKYGDVVHFINYGYGFEPEGTRK